MVIAIHSAQIFPTKQTIPFVFSPVRAGFPSPADDFVEHSIDLNETLIKNPASTFLIRVAGHSMKNAGIEDGDTLVVNRAAAAVSGCIIIAILDGEFTVKRLKKEGDKTFLVPENNDFKPIEITAELDATIWGVVELVIHKTR